MAPSTLNLRNLADGLAPRIVLLLDAEGLLVSAKSTSSDFEFDNISDYRGTSVHDFLHPDCSGFCEFGEMWAEGFSQLQQEDVVEWELNDRFMDKLLRFTLTRPPSSREAKSERRRRNALLTIGDITKYRKAHESLRQREEELVALVRQQNVELTNAERQLEIKNIDDEGDAGILAEFERKVRMHSHRVIVAQENERKRIASDLHDGIAQTLTILKYNIQTSIENLQTKHENLDLSMLESVAIQIQGAMQEIRRISANLAPTMLDDFGLQVAVEWLCEEFESCHSDIDIHLSASIKEKQMPNPISIAIYRIIQEALNNVSKHSGASQVTISIDTISDGITLNFSDDGIGFFTQGKKYQKGDRPQMGLRNMRERAEAIGGTFAISSAENQGTKISATWPGKY